jgi:hypothetical protein
MEINPLGTMHHFKILFAYLVALSFPLFAANPPVRPISSKLPEVSEPATPIENPLHSLDNLIDVTEKHLQTQNQLKKLVIEYLQVRQRYLDNMQDDDLALRMVDLGTQISDLIKKNHLAHVFDQEHLNEWNVCAQISQKN